MIMSGIRVCCPAWIVSPLRSRRSLTRALVLASMAMLTAAHESRLVPAARAAEGTTAVAFADFLQERGIDRSARDTIEHATAWDADVQRVAIRVLRRLGAPEDLWRGWKSSATPYRPDASAEIGDGLVTVQGRAVFVAPQPLDEEERALAGQESYDVVRIVPEATGSSSAPVDVIVLRAPRAWVRWRVIDEPAVVIGLPLGKGSMPRPGPAPADGTSWPEAPASLLIAATAVEFRPATPLGSLGMDYALFDAVRDGGKLVAGDTNAVYGMLKAVGGLADDPSAGRTDIVPIIDPSQRWFERHRGDPVSIVGVARKATRIAIDEPWRRDQTGIDAYWELFVFVDTPPLQVDGREQESYPVVCLVRDVPAGMPTGDSISERVRVNGFALKRYGYPLANVDILSSDGDEALRGRRMETALVVGRSAEWRPIPPMGPTDGFPTWLFLGIVAAVAALIVAGFLSGRRESRLARTRSREELPERIDVPPGTG
jgi:hypothetical protein